MTHLRSRTRSARRRRISTPFVAGLVAASLVLVGSACGSSDESPGGASDDSSSDAADATGVPTDSTGAPTDATDGSAASGDAGVATLTIETDTGESWSLVQDTCTYTPDAEGGIVELWGASADIPTGGGFAASLFMTDRREPAVPQYSGVLVDEVREVAYTVANGEAVSDGSTMTLTLGMYATNDWELGDPIDLTATVTCQL